MTKKLVLLDMDGTLTESRVVVDLEMVELLQDLMKRQRVAVVSGCSLDRFNSQLLAGFDLRPVGMVLFPSCGMEAVVVDDSAPTGFCPLYADSMPSGMKEDILREARKACAEFGITNGNFGPVIDERQGEICIAALGVDAPLFHKQQWDPWGILPGPSRSPPLARMSGFR